MSKIMKKHIYHVLVLALGFGIGFTYSTKAIVNAAEAKLNESKSLNAGNDFSEKALIDLMKELKIKYPEVVLGQARNRQFYIRYFQRKPQPLRDEDGRKTADCSYWYQSRTRLL
jgi:hypothetical protein